MQADHGSLLPLPTNACCLSGVQTSPAAVLTSRSSWLKDHGYYGMILSLQSNCQPRLSRTTCHTVLIIPLDVHSIPAAYSTATIPLFMLTCSCRCKHRHTEHCPVSHACKKPTCSCSGFHSPWVCNCDHPWASHKQVIVEKQVDNRGLCRLTLRGLWMHALCGGSYVSVRLQPTRTHCCDLRVLLACFVHHQPSLHLGMPQMITRA